MDHPEDSAPGGLAYALVAYLVWGVMPLYLLFVRHVPPLELVGWRVIFTLPICLLVVVLRRQAGQLRLALGNPRILGVLAASAVLIGINWITFITAVQSGHVLAASLGYYINPLVNVLFGTLFLRERLSTAQWIAVALAAVGVSILAWGAFDTLWISLTLAFSFASYGLVRKIAPVESLPGLTIETLIWLVPAIAVVAVQAAGPAGSSMAGGPADALLIAFSGVMTATPLLLFAIAARRMDYSALGFVQFLSPTMSFLIGLFVFREELPPAQMICFIFIWLAIAVFSFDLLSRRNRRRAG